MNRHQEIEETRVRILDKYHERIFDPQDTFSYEQYRDLSHRFTINAAMLQIPSRHKWLVKLTDVFNEQIGNQLPSSRLTIYDYVTAIYNDNEQEFSKGDPENCSLSLRKVLIAQAPTDSAGKFICN